MELSPGTRVGSFEILSSLGAGGMGSVYRARDAKLGRDIAIKIVQEKLLGRPDHLERFQREARSASALNHPNIITIYEIGQHDASPFIAMEFVEGDQLRQMMKRGPVPVRKALHIAAQIANGLAAAHERRIVHRDLKPENVMVTPDGRVKILDFGLARLHREPADDSSTSDLITIDTPDGLVIGTAAYMSPEQANATALDHRSDQFALGTILWEMLTGKHPFRRATTLDTLSAIVHDEPVPIEQLNEKVPVPLRWIIKRCLEKDRDQRYASTRDLAHDLRVLHERMDEASAPKIQDRPRPRVSRAILAPIVGLACVTAAFGLWRLRNEPKTALPPRKVVAVLPFKDLTAQSDGKVFCEGLAETVSTRLDDLEGIQVISPAASAKLVKADADLKRIADELGATMLLHASVQRIGDQIRINYAVLDPRGLQLATDAMTTSADDPLAIQDQFAESIAAELDLVSPTGVARGRSALTTRQEQDRYVRALGHLQQLDNQTEIDTAIQLLRQVVQSSPNSALVHAALGRAYLAKYRLTNGAEWSSQAIESCNRARKLDPTGAEVLLVLGEVRRLTGDFHRAVAEYKRALSLQPDSPEAALGLAGAHEGLKQYPEAEAMYRRGIALRDTWWYGYNRLGIYYLNRGQYDDAAKNFEQVIKLNPSSPWGYSNLGVIHMTRGDFQNGIAAFNKAISIRQDANALSNLGHCYYFQGEFDKAADAYRRAISLNPRISPIWSNLGDACSWATTCRSGEARAAYRRAIELGTSDLKVNPRDARVHGTLAVAFAKLGEREKSKRHIDKALELEGDNPARMYQAARVANLVGDSSEAIGWLRRAFAAGYQKFEAERDPEFRRLRSDSAFREALATAGQTL